ncbi:hypothetical protein GCM10027034_13510 [Ramlibacter solisilvae]|uniref:hypothetical protein n=1 Tax=Ramlibacter tataouinensis TaxID=94132 RepID=UPI0007770A7D|nr:hypothetical protein [Ramlibacter tataouinensis]
MNQSIRQISVVIAAMAACASAPGAYAQAAAPAASATSVPVRIGGERVTVAGQVTDINTDKREVTLRTDEGRELKFGVDPSLKLEKVKVGDRVEMEYLVAVALALKKGGGEDRQKVEQQAQVENPAGGPAGGARARRTTLVADVLSVDRDQGTVRLRGPEGRIVDAKVDKSRLEEVRAGDQVIAVVDEALAVDIHSPSAMGAAPAASGASSPSR